MVRFWYGHHLFGGLYIPNDINGLNMSMKLNNISREDYDHYYHKWLYYYGGAGDVVSLKEFVKDYDSNMYGEIDVYSQDICPCIMCVMSQ